MGAASALESFQWTRQPKAEGLVRELVGLFLKKCEAGRKLADRMKKETGTRFGDWIDSIVVPADLGIDGTVTASGFVLEGEEGGVHIYRNPNGIFPRIGSGGKMAMRVMLKVDSVADFLAANGIEATIEGEPFGPMRKAMAARGDDVVLEVVERRGWTGLNVPAADKEKALATMKWLEQFRRRQREFEQEKEGFAHAMTLIEGAAPEIGRDRACAIFFMGEREYWQGKNRAAQVQKARQDRLGLGWGNHDHHTYRSSRACFQMLVGVMEKLGLECRERFYAGKEAGWGAQVMENPRAGIVGFLDVDLAPEELMGDFAHEPLAPRDKLGTVGLWCGLHGEAFLEAGMHHLECQFDFEALKKQLEEQGVGVMKPFTDFPYLRQAFTEGERWKVAEGRIAKLLKAGLITTEQAETFRSQGAIGSHLENLERNEGFKGFNQKGVSEIIAATDPRKQK